MLQVDRTLEKNGLLGSREQRCREALFAGLLVNDVHRPIENHEHTDLALRYARQEALVY